MPSTNSSSPQNEVKQDRRWGTIISDLYGKRQSFKEADRFGEDLVLTLTAFRRMLDDIFEVGSDPKWNKIHKACREERSAPNAFLFEPEGMARRVVPELLAYQESSERDDPVKSSLVDRYEFSRTREGLLRVTQRTVSLDEEDE